ncbi:hypothetical protein AB0F15_39410 [Amycolatopsis sp. NPDC026612]|uniref:hypothetical protein n=1 Tax=Amycolatopsis sp. NPDC026612 TaxID=3155466 RepID=UPI003402F1FE
MTNATTGEAGFSRRLTLSDNNNTSVVTSRGRGGDLWGVSRNRVKWSIAIGALVAGLAAAGAIVVFGIDGDTAAAGRGVSAEVTERGVSLSVDGIVITGPAGVAPAGTVLTANIGTRAPFGAGASMFTGAGSPLELKLTNGSQPAKPLSIRFPVRAQPPAGAAGVLLTNPSGSDGTHLIPAVFDTGQQTLTAEIDHLSSFWPGFFDFGKLAESVKRFAGQTTGITSARPGCATSPVTTGDGTSVTLGGAVVGDPVWSCLRVENGQAIVTMTPNSPLPWLLHAAPDATLEPPGTVDVDKAAVLAGYDTLIKTKPYAEGLLVPGVPRTYRFPVAQLPGVITGKIDTGTYLGMALLFGVEEALEVFGVDVGRLEIVTDAVRCLGDAIEAAHITAPPNADAVAGLTKAVLSCVSTAATAAGHQAPGPVKVVIGILTSGVSLVAAGLQGVVRTATGSDTFTINVDARVPPVDLHRTKLTSIRVPASLCDTNGDFTLRNGSAAGIPSRYGPLDAGTTGTVVYGDLDGDGHDEAAIDVYCNYSGGNGVPGQGFVVITGKSGKPAPIGVVKAQTQTPQTYLSAVEKITISRGRIEATEDWYHPDDAHCCPSGRAQTTWTYAAGKLTPGKPRI